MKHTVLSLLASAACATAVWGASWQEAINSVEQSAKEYRQYAVEVGGTSWAGTMYNGWKAYEHRCAILGRMLGHASEIKHIEEFDYPPMDERSDAHELLVFSISLENWVGAARWALDASESDKANVWNLDCVGKFGISGSLFIESSQPNAEFEVRNGQLHVYGDIDQGFSERFIRVLNENPEIREVTLGSAGGSVLDAVKAGQAIRERGLNTTIYGNCYSACPLVFLGGVRRVVWAAPHRLGFHQMYVGQGEPVPLDDPMYLVVGKYVALMGADPMSVIRWMSAAPPQSMYEPDLDELCASIVATFVQRRCGIDIKQ